MLSPHLARLLRTFRSTCRLLREFARFARAFRVFRAISREVRCAKRTLVVRADPANEVGAQCKWGRHCCRPHSHRPVVPSSGEPSDGRLAPDVSQPFPEGPGGSFTGARADIRFRPRFGWSEDRALVWRDRNRAFHDGLPSQAVCAFAEAFAYPIDVRPDCPADSGAPFAVFSNGPLASGRSLCHAFLEHRADSLRYLVRFQKVLRFQVFRPSIEELFFPFRCLETALAK